MNKKNILNFLVKINFYHNYINAKYFFRNLIIRIFGEIKVFKFIYLKKNPKKLNLYINRNSFGESIYEYVNALSNIINFIKKDFSEINSVDPLKKINIFIIGGVVNRLLDDWFYMNLHNFLKDQIIYKKDIDSKRINYKLRKNKELNIILKSNYPLLSQVDYFIRPRFGVIGSYTNRYDMTANYTLLKRDERFVSLESLSAKRLDNETKIILQNILCKNVVIFYDYDIDNRKNKVNEGSKNNNLSEELYLRYVDNKIIFETLEFLLKNNYNVVRLGRSNNSFPIKNNNFYDLAYELNNKNKLQNLDFLLPFNSKFCITLGCGAHECSRLFGLPMFYVGYHRLDNFYQLDNCMIIPKKFIKKEDNSLLPLSKLIKMRIIPYKRIYWESKNIYIKLPTSNDLVSSLKEFLKYLKLTEDKDFSNLKIKEINNWQDFYLKHNSFYNSLRSSKFRRKGNFSVIISKFELKKYSKLYSK